LFIFIFKQKNNIILYLKINILLFSCFSYNDSLSMNADHLLYFKFSIPLLNKQKCQFIGSVILIKNFFASTKKPIAFNPDKPSA